jgi:hypothetical protein
MIWNAVGIGVDWFAVSGRVRGMLTPSEAGASAECAAGARFPGEIHGPYFDEDEATEAVNELERVENGQRGRAVKIFDVSA